MNFIIQLIVGIVLTVASTLLQQAFAPEQQKQAGRAGRRGTASVGGKVPKYFLIGTVGDAGKRESGYEWGENNGAPNAYAVDVISFGDLPISGITGLYVNGVEDTISGSGHVTQGYPVTGDKAGNLWVEFFDGTQETASSYLTGKFGSDPDRSWESDMVGVGIPYGIFTTLLDESKWTKSHQDFVCQFQGIPLYDPREDTTAGGSGSQRWADQSTWAFSDNPMVIIYNIERGIYYDGEHVWGGEKTEAQMPYDAWAAAMEACDEDVDLDAGGTEKRFRGGRRINFNERPADVIKEFLIGSNSRIVHCSDGTVYPLVGVPESADGAFTDADVLATNRLGTIPFPNLDEVINGATATFRAPQQAWEDKETAPYYRSDLEAKDDGRRQIEGLDLGVVFSGTQAQRVLKATIEEGRRFVRHVVALPPEFAVYRPLQVLEWTSDRFDYTSKKFLITVRTRDIWGNVIFGLQEVDPTDHAWVPATDESPITFAPVVTNRPAPQLVTAPEFAPHIIQDNDGTNRRPSIELNTIPEGQVDIRAWRIQIRLDGETSLAFDSEVPYSPADEDIVYVLNGTFIRNTDYEGRYKPIPFSGRQTLWSNQEIVGGEIVEGAWLAVTTPNVGLRDTDFNVDLGALITWFKEGVPDILSELESIGGLLSEIDLATYAQQKSLERRLVVGFQEINASFVEVINVAIGEGGAIATSIAAVQANFDEISAQGQVKFEAVASPNEGYARYAIMVSADNGETFGFAGTFWEVNASTGDSRVISAADEHVFLDEDSNEIFTFNKDGNFSMGLAS